MALTTQGRSRQSSVWESPEFRWPGIKEYSNPCLQSLLNSWRSLPSIHSKLNLSVIFRFPILKQLLFRIAHHENTLTVPMSLLQLTRLCSLEYLYKMAFGVSRLAFWFQAACNHLWDTCNSMIQALKDGKVFVKTALDCTQNPNLPSFTNSATSGQNPCWIAFFPK